MQRICSEAPILAEPQRQAGEVKRTSKFAERVGAEIVICMRTWDAVPWLRSPPFPHECESTARARRTGRYHGVVVNSERGSSAGYIVGCQCRKANLVEMHRSREHNERLVNDRIGDRESGIDCNFPMAQAEDALGNCQEVRDGAYGVGFPSERTSDRARGKKNSSKTYPPSHSCEITNQPAAHRSLPASAGDRQRCCRCTRTTPLIFWHTMAGAWHVVTLV